MNTKQRMEASLTAAFSPAGLEVTDDSHQHAGHSGWRQGGETHFTVRITAAAFTGLGRIARHRAIHAALVAELQGGVHALAIEARAPGEAPVTR